MILFLSIEKKNTEKDQQPSASVSQQTGGDSALPSISHVLYLRTGILLVLDLQLNN